MKRILLSVFLISSFTFAQTNSELKSEIENIKTEINLLKTEIQHVKSQNLYFKKVLDISKPILEQENDNNEYRITKVVGNTENKTISITFLIEATNENKTSFLQGFSLIDLLGNEYKPDFSKSSNTNLKLSKDVPMKVFITFKDIIEEPKIIKLFRFNTRNEPERNALNSSRSHQEFRDLNVIWE